jgi:hypothetical protein
MVEMLIVCVLGVLVSLALMSFSVFMAKMCKTTYMQLRFAHLSRSSVERMAKVIRYAKWIEVNSTGVVLSCLDENGTSCTIYYQDGDNNPRTLRDNCIYMIPDAASGGGTQLRICRYVTPFPGEPIFRYVDRSSAVEINYRIGDPRNDPVGYYTPETGPGPQGVDVHTAYGPRNSFLD